MHAIVLSSHLAKFGDIGLCQGQVIRSNFILSVSPYTIASLLKANQLDLKSILCMQLYFRVIRKNLVTSVLVKVSS